VLVGAGALVTLLLIGAYDLATPDPQRISDWQFMTRSTRWWTNGRAQPSIESAAYATVIKSVVRVDGYEDGAEDPAAAKPEGQAEIPPRARSKKISTSGSRLSARAW
jgi:serine protease DegQ